MQNHSIWQSEILYHSGDAYYDALIDAIGAAQRQVLLETYIFELDAVGRRVLAALAQAAARGVKVQVLVDGFGSIQWAQSTLEQLRKQGIRAKIYHPIAPHAFSRGPAFLRRWLHALSNINRRNHRKVCVIDGSTAFLGGMNISHKHSEAIAGAKAWRDTSVQVSGAECARLVRAFELAWNAKLKWRQRLRRRKKNSKFPPSANLILNYRRRMRAASTRQYCERVASAATRVWITNPYFVPNLRLTRALRRAARRGVDVRMIFPRTSDVPLMRILSPAFYGALLEAGVRIFEYLPTVLHAKITIVDQWCSVGSSNLNHRSLMHDLEVDVALRDPQSLTQLEAVFQHDLHMSEEVNHSRWLGRSRWRRLLEWIFSRLSYWA